MEGAEARESHTFTPWLEAMAGLDYNEDDIHRDNLDHYLSADPKVYGPFLKVLSNDITIREAAPFVALHGDLGKHVHFYAGLRHEQIELDNTDKLKPEQSSDQWQGFENPQSHSDLDSRHGTGSLVPFCIVQHRTGFFLRKIRASVWRTQQTRDHRPSRPHSSAPIPNRWCSKRNFAVPMCV